MGNQYYKARHKAAGLCVNDSNPVYGNSQYCVRCYVKMKQRRHLYYVRNREKELSFARARHKQYIQEGRCSKCGRQKNDLRRKTCFACKAARMGYSPLVSAKRNIDRVAGHETQQLYMTAAFSRRKIEQLLQAL